MTEKDIQRVFYKEYSKKFLTIIPNTYHFGEESDLLGINKRGYLTEFEIKISVRDFKRDFKKKGKHTLLSNRTVAPVTHWYRRNKTFRTTENIDDAKSWSIPNRYAFLVPENLIRAEDVPEYAGLYYCIGKHSIREIKKPP